MKFNAAQHESTFHKGLMLIKQMTSGQKSSSPINTKLHEDFNLNLSFKELKLKIEPSVKDKSMNNEDAILLGLRAPEFEFERKPYILYPNDNAKVNWDLWISLVLLITCF